MAASSWLTLGLGGSLVPGLFALGFGASTLTDVLGSVLALLAAAGWVGLLWKYHARTFDVASYSPRAIEVRRFGRIRRIPLEEIASARVARSQLLMRRKGPWERDRGCVLHLELSGGKRVRIDVTEDSGQAWKALRSALRIP